MSGKDAKETSFFISRLKVKFSYGINPPGYVCVTYKHQSIKKAGILQRVTQFSDNSVIELSGIKKCCEKLLFTDFRISNNK